MSTIFTFRSFAFFFGVLWILVGVKELTLFAEEKGWSSFRGGRSAGVAAEGDYPADLDLTTSVNLQWQTTVPGIGHSSPIISDDMIVVTTAYSSRQYESLIRGCSSFVSITCLLLAIVAGVCLSADINSIAYQRPGTGFYLARGLLICLLGPLLLAQMHLGPKIFDYARCPIRSWLGPHLASTLGLTMALSLSLGRRWLRFANVMMLAIMAAAILFLIPAKDHVYRLGVFGAQSLVVTACALLPITFLSGMLVLYSWLFLGDPAARSRGYRILGGLTATLFFMTICVVRITMTSHVEHLVTDHTVPAFFSQYRVFQLGFVSVVMGAAFALFQRRLHRRAPENEHGRRLRKSDVLNIWRPVWQRLVVLGCLLSVVGLTVTCLAALWNGLIFQSTFLQYHLPPPDWSTLHHSGFFMSAVLMVSTAILGIIFPRCIERMAPWCGPTLSAFMLLLYPVHVIEANGVHREPHCQRAVVALDRHDGSVRWMWEGFPSPRDIVHRENSQATPTPIAQGDRIVAWFGSAGLVCLDARTGRELWSRSDIDYHSVYGTGASPVVIDDCIIIVADAPRDAKILGIQLSTGRTLWEQDRSALMPGIYADSGHSHTPLIITDSTRSTAWVTGWDRVTGYDCADGTILLDTKLKGGGDRVASAAADERHVYWGSSGQLVAADKSSLSQGLLSVLWHNRADSNCVSPVSDGQHVFTCSDSGIFQCLDAASGKLIWRDRLPGEFRSSPIIAGGLLYLGQLDGVFFVLDLEHPNHQWRQFRFSSGIFATPAVDNGQLIVRTESAVYCFSRQAVALAGPRRSSN